MAESIVSFLLDKLSFLIEKKADLILGVGDRFMGLRDELKWIRCVLEDAEKKRGQSRLVEAWLTDLTDLAYDAEDVIDAYMLHVEQQRTNNFLSKIIDIRNRFETLHKLGKQMEEINTRARNISTRKSDYNLESLESNQDSGTESIASRRRSIPTLHEFAIVGLQTELTQVENWMNEEVPQRQVISIIGMGGLGKTTLAGNIYKNEDVSSHFDARVWISVSQEYQERDLLLRALKQVPGGDVSRLEQMDNGELKNEFWERLYNKRYFVVIDDIWNVEAWDQIGGALPNNEKRSRVILTTRKKEVASYADSSRRNHLELPLLNEDESWKLFCKKVFLASGGNCPPEFVKLGKEIVGKCCGLPLAIVVIGGILMAKERTPNAWSRVLDRVTWQLSQDSNQCRQILILSYIDLPYILKSCFLYLGLFPEDFEIDAEKLIMLWVAEGFVQARGEENMEDVAEDCLEELVQRSMIQVTDRMYHGGAVKCFRFHDLLRDLSISEARKNRFLDTHPSNHYAVSTTTPRRFGFHASATSIETGHFPSFTDPKLRSLLLFPGMQSSVPFPGILRIDTWKSTFGDGKKMIRVLELQGVRIKKGLPKEIGELIFLHYLGLRETEIRRLPSSTGNLVKLQTLNIQLTKVKSLPKTIWNLKNLRHLFLPSLCLEFEKANSAVMEEFGRNLLTLEVNGGFSMTKDDARPSDFLAKLRCLRSLRVESKLVVSNDQNLRKCFSSSLTELSLEGTYIEEDPSEVLGSLPKLKSVIFAKDSYTGRVMDFSSGGFPQLQLLSLNSLFILAEWIVAEGAIPSLTHLRIKNAYALNKLPDGLKNVTTLQKLELLFMFYSFEERVKEDGEDWDKIKHIPFIHIETLV